MIVITRPLPQALQTKAKLQQLGFASKHFPLLEIQPIEFTIKASYDYIIITSQNAALVLSQAPFIKAKLLVVGNKAAAILRSSGYKVAHIAPTAESLYQQILIESDGHNMLYLRGDHTAFPLEKKMKALDSIVVYKSIAATYLPEDILVDANAILFYSPRTAAVFQQLSTMPLRNIRAICISNNAANKLQAMDFMAVDVAKAPNEESMLEIVCKIK